VVLALTLFGIGGLRNTVAFVSNDRHNSLKEHYFLFEMIGVWGRASYEKGKLGFGPGAGNGTAHAGDACQIATAFHQSRIVMVAIQPACS
jgi:hypothetical protein